MEKAIGLKVPTPQITLWLSLCNERQMFNIQSIRMIWIPAALVRVKIQKKANQWRRSRKGELLRVKREEIFIWLDMFVKDLQSHQTNQEEHRVREAKKKKRKQKKHMTQKEEW